MNKLRDILDDWLDDGSLPAIWIMISYAVLFVAGP